MSTMQYQQHSITTQFRTNAKPPIRAVCTCGFRVMGFRKGVVAFQASMHVLAHTHDASALVHADGSTRES